MSVDFGRSAVSGLAPITTVNLGYSITSSAMLSSEGGTLPNDRKETQLPASPAVVRLPRAAKPPHRQAM
jgi:hypothetical protein